MMRLFVGLELPVSQTERLEPLCSGLRDVRWVDAHNMHITLAFIGDIDEGMAEDLHKALAHITFDPFSLYLAEMGNFATRGHPKQIWADVKGDVDALKQLHHKVLSAISNVGLEPERRKYKPHVTICRLRESASQEKIRTFMEVNNQVRTPTFEVGYITLFRSHLTRHGAEYEVLERYGRE